MEFYDPVDFDELLNDLAEEESTISEEQSTTSEDYSTSSSDAYSLPVVFKSKMKKVPKKLRLRMYAKEIHIPKILKSDIRNSYPSMFANILNSGEFPLVFGFLDTFLVPTIKQSYVKTITDTTNEVSFMRGEQAGKFELSKYWCNYIRMGPDMVFHLRNPRIHSHSKTNCVQIVSDFTVEGTKIYGDPKPTTRVDCHKKVENEEENIRDLINRKLALGNEYTKREQRKRELDEMRELDEKRELCRQIELSVENHFQTLTLREKPINFKGVGTLIMYTDEEKRITKVEMDTVVDNRFSTLVLVH